MKNELTRYTAGAPNGRCFLRPVKGGPDVPDVPVYRCVDADARIAELETEVGALTNKRYWEIMDKRDRQFWKDGTEPADPPVGRGELAAMLSELISPLDTNMRGLSEARIRAMHKRLEAGLDARGEG